MKALTTRAKRIIGGGLLLLVSGCRDGCDEPHRRPAVDARAPRADSANGAGGDASQGHPAGPWRVAVMPAFAEGAIRARDVEDAVRSRQRALEACALTVPMPDIDRVRVMLRLSIGGDGAVFDVTPIQPRPESQAVLGCVLRLARAWSFPRSDAAATRALLALEFTTEAM